METRNRTKLHPRRGGSQDTSQFTVLYGGSTNGIAASPRPSPGAGWGGTGARQGRALDRYLCCFDYVACLLP